MGLLNLFRPKWQHSDPNVRKVAVEGLMDQLVLAKVATNDSDPNVRKVAVEGLMDQLVLANVARNDRSYWVRAAAARRLTDQTLLSEIANNDSEWYVQKSARDALLESCERRPLGRDVVVQLLWKSIGKDKDMSNAVLAANAISKFAGESEVKKALIAALNHQPWSPHDSGLIHSERTRLHAIAASALAPFAAEAAVRDALCGLLRSSEECWNDVHGIAADALADFITDRPVRDAFIETMCYRHSCRIVRILEVLSLALDDPEVRTAFVYFIKHDWHSYGVVKVARDLLDSHT